VWLMYEGLLAVEDGAGRRRKWPIVAFCALVGGSWTYLFDISRFSGIEASVLLLGIVTAAAGRIERGLSRSAAAGPIPWALLGAVIGGSLYTRPQVEVYAVPATMFLLFRLRRLQPAAVQPALTAVALGAFAGYVPMLLHDAFRAPSWPFRHHVGLKIGTARTIPPACREFFTDIAPRLFALGFHHPLYSALTLAWIAAAATLFAAGWRRGGNALSAVDRTWGVGSALLALMMFLLPRLSVNAESRRYCLQIIPGVAWVFARLAATTRIRRTAASILIAAMLILSLPQWTEMVRGARETDRAMREAESAFVPYLQAQHAPILAQYWDAYLLAFLSDGTLRIEAYPWDLVRTYGWLKEADMARRTVWLVKMGSGHDVAKRLAEECGESAVRRLRQRDAPLPLLDRPCELWEFPPGREAIALMKNHHPRYFTTPYPPGSRAADNR